MQQGTIMALAVAMAVFATPLFLDLAVCIVGNLRRAPGPHAAQRRTIRLAVVVPAHDEETMIARTVRSLKAADAATQIYVVAHNCSDATGTVAEKAGAVVVDLKNPKLRGKGAALRHGFAAALEAGANAFLVIDADSVVSSNLIAATRARLEEGAAVTQCRYELELPGVGSGRPMTRLRALAFRGMNVLRARGRAGLGFSTGLFGNGFALTAATLERAPFSANSIAEDVEYHTKLACKGVRVFWVGEAFVHAHMAASGRAQATQEGRWEGGRFKVGSQATGHLMAAVLQGRWRAVETLADVWSLPLSRGILALMLMAALPLHWLHVFAGVCAGIALIYVLEAALLGTQPMRDLASLTAAPLYLVWKVAITPIVLLQSRSRAEWARTKREAPQP
jgi:cellulose synthase/poly-beta-1,6-N-acetylglucosamine synthase-like glycosyltransferase